MSKATRRVPANKASVGSRSFRRRLKSQRAHAARRPTVRKRAPSARRGLAIGAQAAFKRVPTAAWVCALIAFLNGAAWSIITPPFQGRDEPSHFAYVQLLAETGTLPHDIAHESGLISPEEGLVLNGLNQAGVAFSPQTPAISSMSEQRTLMRYVNAGLSREGPGEAGVATSEPPLYYALETVPYAIGAENTLTQLELMRLLSALLGALTVLLSFFFLREALPGAPWAATVGAVCIAVQPLFGFMSGTLNPDTMLYTVSAALFLCLARGFRRGLTRRLAIAIGLLIAIGFMTKLNFVGVAFGVFSGAVLLGVREARRRGREGLVSPAIIFGIGCSPVALYALVNVLSNHPTFGFTSGATSLFTGGSTLHEISYVWDFYAPRLPGMTHYFEGVSTYRDVWFDDLVGLYGWVDTRFPAWVNNVALVPVGVIVLLCGRALIVQRDRLRARLPELVTYATICLGVLVMVGLASYSADIVDHSTAYSDPRYLLPMLPLLGAVLTLAVRGAGRRWAPATAAVIVVLFLAHDIFSQLQVIARYYG